MVGEIYLQSFLAFFPLFPPFIFVFFSLLVIPLSCITHDISLIRVVLRVRIRHTEYCSYHKGFWRPFPLYPPTTWPLSWSTFFVICDLPSSLYPVTLYIVLYCCFSLYYTGSGILYFLRAILGNYFWFFLIWTAYHHILILEIISQGPVYMLKTTHLSNIVGKGSRTLHKCPQKSPWHT